MDGTNPRMAQGWMDLFHHGKTGANAIDTHRHAKRVESDSIAVPEADTTATRTAGQLTPITSAEAEALDEFKRLLNKRPARTDAERRVEQLVERAEAARNAR